MLRDEEAVGSNPATPTDQPPGLGPIFPSVRIESRYRRLASMWGTRLNIHPACFRRVTSSRSSADAMIPALAEPALPSTVWRCLIASTGVRAKSGRVGTHKLAVDKFLNPKVGQLPAVAGPLDAAER
jgi:hypothetical protein